MDDRIPLSSEVEAAEFIKSSHGVITTESLAKWLRENCQELRTRAETAEGALDNIKIVLASSRSQAAHTKTELAAASMALGLAYDKLVHADTIDRSMVNPAVTAETLRTEAEEIMMTAMVDINNSQAGRARIDMLKYADMGANPKVGERPPIPPNPFPDDDVSMFSGTGK